MYNEIPIQQTVLEIQIANIRTANLYVWYREVNCKNQYLELIIQLFNTENIVIIQNSSLGQYETFLEKLNFGHA